jgi:hypothetical protein
MCKEFQYGLKIQEHDTRVVSHWSIAHYMVEHILEWGVLVTKGLVNVTGTF